jgi:uncharacterized protein involved in exopolysaccharide biosynthesis/Mrp family chromosome partitioning ATPase
MRGPSAVRFAELDPFAHIDFGRILLVIRRRIKLIASTTGVALGTALTFMMLATPQYTAVTQILIHPSDLRVVEKELTAPSQISDAGTVQVESQVRVITSDNVLRWVVQHERLDRDSEFTGGTSILRTVLMIVTAPLGLNRRVGHSDPTLQAINELRRRMFVRRAERTYVVDIGVTTNDPAKSTRIANAVTQAYLLEQTAARSESAKQASDSLLARLSELKRRVRDAEDRVEKFKSTHSIVGAGGVLVNEQQLSELNNQLSSARARTSDAKARFEQIQRLQRSGAEVGAIAEAVQSQTIAALRSQYADVMRRVAELTTQLGPRHPAIGDIQAQAQGLRRLINDEVNRIGQAVRNEYERAQANEQALARQLEALKQTAFSTNESLVALRELEREVQASRAIYETFLSRARETGEIGQLDTRNVRVISPADIPLQRSWPPSFMMVSLAAIFLGAAIGGGWVLLRDSRDADVAPVPTVRPIPDLPVLAALRQSDLKQRLLAFHAPGSGFATEIRRLSLMLDMAGGGDSGKSVLIAALDDDDELASAVALNLAAVAAADERVLLIDADVNRRTIGTMLRDWPKGGLVDVALDRMPLTDAVVRDDRTQISLLPLVSPMTRRHRVVTPTDIKVAFDRTQRFDLVVVAGRSHRHDPSAQLFGQLVDHIVPVIKRSDTSLRDIADLTAVLGEDVAKVRGAVVVNPDS